MYILLIVIASILGLIGITLGLFGLYMTLTNKKIMKELNDERFYD